MARKTFSVAALLFQVNSFNRKSTLSPDARKGCNSLLEGVLHATDMYRGFDYLGATEVPEGQLPGIRYDGINPSFADTDETRHSYYVASDLVAEYTKLVENQNKNT